MADDLLRFATFLAPNIFGVYRFVADYVGEKLGYRPELVVGSSFGQFAVERLVTVTDEDYHGVRAMLAAAEDAGFMTLR
jgi:hypothetical protein